MHLNGDLQVPGFKKSAADCPEDLLEREPELPKLNILTPTKELYPKIPESVVADWSTHAEFGADFRAFLDKLVEEFGPIPTEEVNETDKATAKEKTNDKEKEKDQDKENQKHKKRTSFGSGLPVAKRQKLCDSTKVATIESVGRGSVLAEVPMVNARMGGTSLHVKVGNKIYIFNSGQAESCLKSGTILCGYGKGKFRFAGKDGQPEGDPAKEVQYKLTGPDQLALCLSSHSVSSGFKVSCLGY